MQVTIELSNQTFLEIEFSFPIIGYYRFAWSDNSQNTYGVLNDQTGAVIKKGFTTYQEAEHWATEENFSIV
jgi:hypothetical protein